MHYSRISSNLYIGARRRLAASCNIKEIAEPETQVSGFFQYTTLITSIVS